MPPGAAVLSELFTALLAAVRRKRTSRTVAPQPGPALAALTGTILAPIGWLAMISSADQW
jgi:hypothetical protein